MHMRIREDRELMGEAGLYPRSAPRTLDSHAEVSVYEALGRSLPNGWTAWHSMKLRDPRGIDAEGDFVIVDPARGMLILEVKGGQVEVRDGLWYQNGRAMTEPPRKQAHGFAGKLRACLKAAKSPVPSYGIATFFPETEFDREPSNSDTQGMVLGRLDLAHLDAALPSLMERALPNAQPVDRKSLRALHDLWGETWVPRTSLGTRNAGATAERIRLDDAQGMLLDNLGNNERMLIHGPAGSGKTVLALEAARREARNGKRVLLLCFTDALARELADCVGDLPITVAPIREYCAELVREGGGKAPQKGRVEGWSEVPLAAAELIDEPFDACFVDEAQDLKENDWIFIQQAVGANRLWAFADDAQAFWEDRSIPSEFFSGDFQLFNPYRCPPLLWNVAEAWRKDEDATDAIQAAIDAGALRIIECPSESSIQKKVVNEVQRFRGEGLQPSDIAILSLRGQTAEGSALHNISIPGLTIAKADAPNASEHVVADTFLRFKGLERPAIIITDVGLVKNKMQTRMHIALTRALVAASVVRHLPLPTST